MDLHIYLLKIKENDLNITLKAVKLLNALLKRFNYHSKLLFFKVYTIDFLKNKFL